MDTVSAGLDAAEVLGRARRVVVKIGSALLVDADGGLRRGWLEGLAGDVARLRARGTEVILVSSGSIALGRGILSLAGGSLRLDESQAAAAVGQIALARSYQEVLGAHGLTAAQILMTLEDSEQRRRYLNARATLRTLLSLGTVPIVNENDTVATDEIRYGDNDRLAAQIASLSGADVLILLSDVDGLYDADPRANPGARHLPLVEAMGAEIEAMAGGAGTATARGGMRTKLIAAGVAMRAGCLMAIALGDVARPIAALEGGARATWFRGAGDPAAARKRWISAMKPRGRLVLDDGALRAIRSGRSLLAAGVTAVEGSFARGDPVAIAGADGVVAAMGLSGYDADEARAILGLKSHEIERTLGHPGRAALVHRDDMAI